MRMSVGDLLRPHPARMIFGPAKRVQFTRHDSIADAGHVDAPTASVLSEPTENRWSPSPKDTRNSREVTNGLSASCVGIVCIIVCNQPTVDACPPTIFAFEIGRFPAQDFHGSQVWVEDL
ncbi:hypothetical protein EVAR_7992_1 [Eumeta japonica]|uniref:Uncharacterized protein n=1 Tax=Eumeta variegata TaxID=151549 RepID=A0A4C1TKD7_EUMVA|nr:hypothetical protein EVAR_7992_1 [Eumeta japonica]